MKSSLFLSVGIAALAGPVLSETSPAIDLDGDGLDDVWSTYYSARGLSPLEDSDGDGVLNRDEAIAGTDPLSRQSVFRTEAFSVSGTQCSVSWKAEAGKHYEIETSGNLTEWTPTGIVVTDASGLVTRRVEGVGTSSFCRIRVRDIDADGDGLSAWSEALLATSDANLSSTAKGHDLVAAIARLGTPGMIQLGDRTLSALSPSLADSSRFLQQATMGADYEMIVATANVGIAPWIESQFQIPATSHVATVNALGIADVELELPLSNYIWTWWDTAMNGQDVLRQRVAFALSEIFVLGQTTDTLEDHYWGIATYYDILVNNAFGNYRDLLYQVSTNPAMGHYLSHVKNQPTNLAQNLFPDENYAREVMQLFSIGLFELNQDGSRKKDASGKDIPTYDNSHITAFARVFTGLTYNPENPNNGLPYSNEDNVSFIGDSLEYLNAESMWMGVPMVGYEPMHERGVKTLLRGQITDGNLQEDLDAAIDNLFNHPNTGPFIGRLLIQRLVTSNPSADYISRVSAAFADNGSGVRGDMKAVIRAILLDPEARNRSKLQDPTHGKLREPVIRHVHLARAFNLNSSTGRYQNDHGEAREAYAQQPMRANSVFNFYLPDHQPLGAIKANNLVAPEFQITTATTTIKTLNLWSLMVPEDRLIFIEEEGVGDTELTMDYRDELALAGDIPALIDRLDLVLTRGQMSATTRAALTTALRAASSSTVDEDLVRFAVTIIASSPDFAVLR